MSRLPEKSEQILQAHAGLVHRVVMACQNRDRVPDLEQVLELSEKNGWRRPESPRWSTPCAAGTSSPCSCSPTWPSRC